MPRNVTVYDLLVSCPGDVVGDIRVVDKAVERFNSLYSSALGISIQTRYWKKDAYAQSGGLPQDLLNKQFVIDCDAAVALFWTRFGTPTDQYGSGTEEEIEIMLNAGKQVFVYFSERPLPPSKIDASEYQRVCDFKEKYCRRGLFFSYTTEDELEKLFFAQLSQHFLTEKRISEIKAERNSKLELKGIDTEGKLSDSAVYQSFRLNTVRSVAEDKAEIDQLYSEITDIHLGPRAVPLLTAGMTFTAPVEMSKNQVEVIREIAKARKIELPNDFFELGNLAQNTLSRTAIFGGMDLKGSQEEKRKYELLTALYTKILDSVQWSSVEASFSEIKCVKLAVVNIGTAIDEDIEITLRIPKGVYRSLEELPEIDEDTAEYILTDCDIRSLLSIPGTADYSDYASSVHKEFQGFPQFANIGGIPMARDYIGDYKEDLQDVFCYDVFREQDSFIIKLKLDYLKHHTGVAFPTAIFLKEKVESITYEITSKNAATVISGELVVR